MTTKKWAVSESAQAVALVYGQNVSRGILAMEARILKLEKELADGRGFGVPGIMGSK